VKPRLGIIVASVREGRIGEPVKNWFVQKAEAHGASALDVIDLKDVALPMFDEPHHPRLQKYTREETKAWSARISLIDAFVFVTPEYNHAAPPSLVNAIDYLFTEWQYKPVGLVSYGGVSGGLRSVQVIKAMLASLKMVPMVEAVPLPFFAQMIDKASGAFAPGEANEKAAVAMLDELVRWEAALKVLRPAPAAVS
jgi:NAD(P)H-dependent FMN reductase